MTPEHDKKRARRAGRWLKAGADLLEGEAMTRLNHRRALAASALILALAGCGGATDAGNPTATTTTPQPVTAADIARRTGCVGFTSDTELELFAVTSGGCDVGGERIHVVTFRDQDAQNQYVKIAGGFGGTIRQGDLWVVSGDDPATVNTAADAAKEGTS